MENEVMFIKLDDIIPNRFQPREVFDEESLNKLADSIRMHGVIEPILVRPVANKFEIIVGERRYKASVLAGLTKIPAIVKQMDDKESSIVAYIENEHRSGVSAIEEARTIDRILKSNDITQEGLAKELGISQSTLANKLRLLSLPSEIQESLMHNEISERHARSLLSVKDTIKQIELLNKIKENKMTVRELDSEIKNMNNSINNEELNGYANNNMTFSQPNILNMMDSSNNYNSTNFNETVPQNDIYSNMNNNSQENMDFMNYLNSYDNNQPNNTVLPEVNSYEQSDLNSPQESNDFMNYLNSYDNNQPNNTVLPEANSYEHDNLNSPQENMDFMNYLNSYDNHQPVVDNSYNNNNILMNDNQNPSPIEDGPSFMNFLNNYDNTNSLPEAPIEENNSTNDFNGFDNTMLNNQNPNNINDNIYLNSNDNYGEISNNNVVINDVIPPITSNFNNNSYIENNPNFVDVSQQTVIANVDEIINKLKTVVDDIKSTSKFKIDTDEINYDDIYQITIKIDKRDF